MIKYRPYQVKAINSIWNYFKSGNTGNPVVAMPTGTGKSIVIAGFIKSVYEQFPTQRVMMITHVKELIEQNFSKLMALWSTAPAGIYSSGLNRRDSYNSITFAGIGSVVKKSHLFGHIDLIIIDEAHLVSPSDSTMYRKFISELHKYNPALKIVGFTATPYRLGQGQIVDGDSLFTDICIDQTNLEGFNRFIDEGYLVGLIPKKTSLTLDVDGVRKQGGEFILKDLQDAVDKNEITEAACKEAIELGHDRHSWLVFTSGVEHAIHTAEILNYLGISAKAIHSGSKKHKMTNEDRNTVIRDFKSGAIRALVNNNILTTGFDHPPIDLILMLRPTSSPGLWCQMNGRGLRPVYAEGFDLTTIEGRLLAISQSQKQNCLVLDFGGNTKRLGPINDPLIPSPKRKKGGDAPVKLCEAVTLDNKICNTWLHASVRICPYCGNEFEFETKLKNNAATEELIKVDLPITKEYKVNHVTFSVHRKMGSPSSMKVSYYCNLNIFNEYVCFEHKGFAKKKAAQWWIERSASPVPKTVKDGIITSMGELSPSTSLRVWINKKYPEILAHCFDGTHFGKEKASSIPTKDCQIAEPAFKIKPAKKLKLEFDMPF